MDWLGERSIRGLLDTVTAGAANTPGRNLGREKNEQEKKKTTKAEGVCKKGRGTERKAEVWCTGMKPNRRKTWTGKVATCKTKKRTKGRTKPPRNHPRTTCHKEKQRHEQLGRGRWDVHRSSQDRGVVAAATAGGWGAAGRWGSL